MQKNYISLIKLFLMRTLILRLFHQLPDGLILFLRSFKKTEQELDILDRFVHKGDLVVDIGANKGAYTYRLARLVGRSGRVEAFEPIKELSGYLISACRQLRLPVDIHSCCLSDKVGKAQLSIPLNGDERQYGLASLEDRGSVAMEVQHVPVNTLDQMLSGRRQPVRFIKCDVEGHELAVFRGAMSILKADRPTLLVEIEQRHLKESIIEHFEFFYRLGYSAFYLSSGNVLKPIKGISCNLLKAGYLEGDLYINNFLFIPEMR